MAHSIFTFILLFVALLLGVPSSNAQGVGSGILVNGSAIVQVNVTGRIFCSPLGNPIVGFPNRPLVGVNVTFSCDDGQTIVGQAVTNTMGVFQITVNASNIDLFNITSCRVIVPLPVNASCIFLPGLGCLQAIVDIKNFELASAGALVKLETLSFELDHD